MSAKFGYLGNSPTRKCGMHALAAFVQPTGTECAPIWVSRIRFLVIPSRCLVSPRNRAPFRGLRYPTFNFVFPIVH